MYFVRLGCPLLTMVNYLFLFPQFRVIANKCSHQALRGKATGCFVDQTKIESEEDAPVTAYYLWLPYLLAICFVLARLPRCVLVLVLVLILILILILISIPTPILILIFILSNPPDTSCSGQRGSGSLRTA